MSARGRALFDPELWQVVLLATLATAALLSLIAVVALMYRYMVLA
jgi:hypothetical protein